MESDDADEAPTVSGSSSWATKAYSAADSLVWMAKLNAIWLLGVIAGGVVLGVAPSTVAAFAGARRRVRDGDEALFRRFWSDYRREFGRANALLLPVGFVGVMLALNWRYLESGSSRLSTVLGGAVLVLAALVAGSVCVLLPMFVHYQLPLRNYYAKASQFALHRLPSVVILLFGLSAVAFVSYLIPGLLVFFSFGAWIYLDTYLAIRFFEHNEAALEGAEGPLAQPLAVGQEMSRPG
jgi:uncharacterized membrane protein YesL